MKQLVVTEFKQIPPSVFESEDGMEGIVDYDLFEMAHVHDENSMVSALAMIRKSDVDYPDEEAFPPYDYTLIDKGRLTLLRIQKLIYALEALRDEITKEDEE